MSEIKSSTRATILFDAPPEIDFVGLVNELKRPFRNIALDFDEIEMDEDLYALFTSDRLSLRIARGQAPVSAQAVQEAGRPARVAEDDTGLEALQRDFPDTLTVSVADGVARSVPERLRVSVCYHVVRHLLQHYEAAAVLWHHTNTLFTATEFETPASDQRPVKPRRPTVVSDRTATPRPAQAAEHAIPGTEAEAEAAPAQPQGGGRAKFAAGYMGVAETHSRLDQSFAQVVDPDHATVAANDGGGEQARSWRDILPNIAPSEEKLRRSRLAIFASDLIEIEDVKLEAPEEEPELPEQLTVYVMTLTLMVIAFPVGFAMLIYNILAGESVNMTARAMALTGFGISMDYAGVTDLLVGMI